MKFMPQDIFEVSALWLAKYKTMDPRNYSDYKSKLHDIYSKDYKGDNLWLQQCDEIGDQIVSLCMKFNAVDIPNMLQIAQEFRQGYDENMEVISGKSIFKGTFFTKSHPSAGARKEVALKNIRSLFMIMISKGYNPS